MTDISPNAPQGTVTDNNAVASLDSIAAKMTAMREQTLRNQIGATNPAEAGSETSAEDSSPVAPDDAVPEIDVHEDEHIAEADLEAEAPQEEVSEDSTDSTNEELIDFIEFADTNPNAKFKFMRNGKEIVIDAKKAAAILGQGAAISEDARQLKIERAEFDEYIKESRAKQEGLTLAMEFTVQPKLRQAYDEILKVQSYQTTFQQQLAQTTDPAVIARIQASMQQNEQYIRQQQETIGQLKPAVDEFRKARQEQVNERLTYHRKNFEDKELKNEKLLSLLRDGLRYRDKPNVKSSGASMAAFTSRKGSTNSNRSSDDGISKLREQAKGGDKKAADNLLMARLKQIRGGR